MNEMPYDIKAPWTSHSGVSIVVIFHPSNSPQLSVLLEHTYDHSDSYHNDS